MTRDEAAKQAKKRWGTKAYWRVGQHTTSPEQRAAALEALRAARDEKEQRVKALQERLNATDWYVEAQAEISRLRQVIATTQGECNHYKFSVGRSVGWANEITGTGDTWEQAFADADARAAKGY
jgi:hypothetical protein